jgi:hypothetical protein
MKKLFIILMTIAITSLSFKAYEEYKKSDARVIQAEGVYIFLQSTPLREYDILGTVKKTGLVWTGQPEEMYRTILRRARRDYPNCEAVIFDDIQMTHATCIKFK